RFRVLGKVPPWVEHVVLADVSDPASAFPFLEVFLQEASALWREGQDGERRSGFWSQRTAGGTPAHLTARAVRMGSLELLTIASSEDDYRDHQLLAQRGRESSLALEQLRKEIQKK